MAKKVNKNLVKSIARVCHQANKAWCELNGDETQNDWNKAEDWQQKSAIAGVEFRINNPDAPESAQHESWMKDKIENGWV